jgi:hypothetical protein
MSRKIHCLAAIAAVALAGSAFAGDLGIDAKANVSLSSIDTDADGKVSKTEAASNEKLAQKFDSLDANKDGNLDKGEFAKFEASGKASGKAGKGAEPATPATPATPSDGSSPTK